MGGATMTDDEINIRFVDYKELFTPKKHYLEKPVPTTKICKDCGIEHPLSEYWFVTRKSGKKAPMARCKKCHLKYQRSFEWHRSYMNAYHKDWLASQTPEKQMEIRKKSNKIGKDREDCAKTMCSKIPREKIIVLTCAQCGKEFGIFYHRLYRKEKDGTLSVRKYCSRNCQWASLKKSNRYDSKYAKKIKELQKEYK